MKIILPISFCTACLLLLLSCGSNKDNADYATSLTFHPGEETKIIEALLSIKDNTQVLLTQGTYHFDNLSVAQVKNVRLQGEGFDKTILDFSSQTQGGEGVRATDVNGFVIDGMTLRESKGDLLKVNKSRNISITNLHTVWKTSDSSNGGYAIYPVLCTNVLIENCYVQGSSDAGIYIGQSDSAIVRNCKAYKNVAGCEIENTTNALVYDNEFYGNTGGFLVFDLPGLSKRGGNTKAYNNYVHDNNERNFAKAGSFGTSTGVGNVSPGTGIVVLSVSDVEIHNNRILNNNTNAITILSGLFTDTKALKLMNDAYFPFSRKISIHDNMLSMGDSFPQPALVHQSGQLFVAIEKKLQAEDTSRRHERIPLILYDGSNTNVLNNGSAVNPDSICIEQSGSNMFVNADLLNLENQKKWHPTVDMHPFQCK